MKKTNQVKLDVFKQQLNSLSEKEDLSTALTRTETFHSGTVGSFLRYR